jgi:hypothetical protein
MKRDLLRYYRLLAAELARVKFSMPEVGVLLEVFERHGMLSVREPLIAGPLWALVDEALERGWCHAGPLVDRDALVQRLRPLSPGGAAAILDALERFLRCPMRDRQAAACAVGLVREDRGEPENAERKRRRAHD